MKYLPGDDLYVIDRFTVNGTVLPVQPPREYRTLAQAATSAAEGQWFRQDDHNVNAAHSMASRRPGSTMSFESFRQIVPGVRDPGANLGFVLTVDSNLPHDCRLAGVQEFAGWLVSRDGVRPASVAVEPAEYGLVQLRDQWPVDRLALDHVVIVGLGSIGGVVAQNLASAGVGRTTLIDPDRFLWHNIVRHVLGRESVGRLKVDAMRDRLRSEWPGHDCDALPFDVVGDAHLVRPLLGDADLVVCAADGIAPRRVVSHIARRASIPAVLACVLDDGGVGEILRLRPSPRFGCLLCHRAALAARGSMDAEADQELAYGTGHVHKPMTAVASDLALVGDLGAKVALSTLLESKHGEAQRLPGEQAVIGLRADLDLAPPFDVSRAGDVRWHDIPEPRTTCPTCRVA